MSLVLLERLLDEEKIKSAGMTNINRHKHSVSSVFFPVVSFNPFWKFLRLRNSAWDFLGLIFGPGMFGFCWQP